jgi:mannan endo-1,6-alpha-mannosidase
MAAAEKNFSSPGPSEPSWPYLAQAVFNTMAARWDAQYCRGGLRWQIFPWNAGYDYKNSVSNGCLFHLAARLARYVGDEIYIEWATKTWDWMMSVGFMSNKSGSEVASGSQLFIYDGSYIANDCAGVRTLEWTYNNGLFLSGCAYLYNHTNDMLWLDRATKIWNRAKVFFNNSIMYEAACQPSNHCNTDQLCFKGIFSRFLGLTMLMAPALRDQIWPHIVASANAAALSCSGGTDGHTCGFNWFLKGWDNTWGLGQQIDALEILNTLLIDTMPPPLSVKQGASNVTDPNAGLNSSTYHAAKQDDPQSINLNISDRAGAVLVTVLLIIGLLGGSWWLLR